MLSSLLCMMFIFREVLGFNQEPSGSFAEATLPQDLESRIEAFQRSSNQATFGIFGDCNDWLKRNSCALRSTSWIWRNDSANSCNFNIFLKSIKIFEQESFTSGNEIFPAIAQDPLFPQRSPGHLVILSGPNFLFTNYQVVSSRFIQLSRAMVGGRLSYCWKFINLWK